MSTVFSRFRFFLNVGIIFSLYAAIGCNGNNNGDIPKTQNNLPISKETERIDCIALTSVYSFLNLPLHSSISEWNKSIAYIAKASQIQSLKMDNEISSRSNYQNGEKHGALIGFLDSGCGIYPVFFNPDIANCYEKNGERINGKVVSSIEIEPAKRNNSSADVIREINEILMSVTYKNITGKSHQSFIGKTFDVFGRNPYIEQAIREGDFTALQIERLRAQERDPYLPDNRRKTEELLDDFLYDFTDNFILVEIVSKCDFISSDGLYIPDGPVYYMWKVKFLSKQLCAVNTDYYLSDEQRGEKDKMKADSVTERYIRQFSN